MRFDEKKLGPLALSIPVKELVRRVRPAIRMRTEEAAGGRLPVGASKLGGAPDLPARVRWPKVGKLHLAHLAQLDLAEVAPLDEAGLLPRSGFLHFFLSIQECFSPDSEGFPGAASDSFRVLYSDVKREQLVRTELPRDLVDYVAGEDVGDEETLAEAALSFEPYASIDPALAAPGGLLEGKEGEVEKVEEALNGRSWVNPLPQLLGYPALRGDPTAFDPDVHNLLRIEGHAIIGGETLALFSMTAAELEERAFEEAGLDMEN